MPSELASFCTFVFKPFCSLKITFSVFWVLPHWVYLFLQTPSPHQISLKSFLLPHLPLSYWPCGFFGSYFLPYKINLLVLLDFSCGHVVWILFFLFFFLIFLKSHTSSEYWEPGWQLGIQWGTHSCPCGASCLEQLQYSKIMWISLFILFSLLQGTWQMASPKICLFKSKIAPNDHWLFLLVEFHVFVPEEFFKAYTWRTICISSYIGVIV